MVRWLVRWFVGSLVRWFVGSLVRWFVGWLGGFAGFGFGLGEKINISEKKSTFVGSYGGLYEYTLYKS
ncbi:MAG: hypothetical protein K9L75_06400 [Spirochaetia bacterium]|nr:hypothetical protein [Spirochaetia bacterium]